MLEYTFLFILCLMSGSSDRWRVSAQNTSLDQPPVTMAAYLNDLAFFTCYIRQSMPAPRLFFFVNSTPVSSLPATYEAQSFSSNPIDGVGTNLTLQIRALKETDNSLIVCGVDVTGRIDRDYFPSPALLLVQGLPSPPTDLNAELDLESSSIVLSWQPPRGLIIEDGITYRISVNISSENLTYPLHENDTHNLSYTKYFVENDSSIELCSLSYLIVSLSSVNNVGKGEEIRKEVDVESYCVDRSTTILIPRPPLEVTEAGANTTACSSNNSEPSLNNSGCITDTAQQREQTLIYVAAASATGLSVLVLSVLAAVVIITCWKKVKSKKGNITCTSKDHVDSTDLQPDTEPNEAYACTMKLKANAAYETRREFRECRHPVCETNTSIILLEHNKAYELHPAAQEQVVIYEEIPAVHSSTRSHIPMSAT